MLIQTIVPRCLPALLPLLYFASGCNEDPTTAGGVGVHERWYQAQPGYAFARPVVAGDLVYFGAGGGQVIARDRATGVTRWATRVTPGEQVGGANLLARGSVVVAPTVLYTTAVDATTGRELWRYAAPLDTIGDADPRPGDVLRSTIDADDLTVFVPAWGASVSAVGLATGAVRWIWEPGKSAGDTASSGVFRSGAEGVRVSGDTLFATVWHSLDRKGLRSEAWLIALEKATGRELWRVTFANQESGVATQAQPALWGNLVIVNTLGGRQIAIDRSTRRVAWRVEADPPGYGELMNANLISPTVVGDVVYHDGSNQYLYARRASDGTLLWRTRYDGQFGNDLFVTDKRIYGETGGTLSIFDRQTGRRLVHVGQPHEPNPSNTMIASGAVVADGQVFITVLHAAWSFTEP